MTLGHLYPFLQNFSARGVTLTSYLQDLKILYFILIFLAGHYFATSVLRTITSSELAASKAYLTHCNTRQHFNFEIDQQADLFMEIKVV